MIYDADLQETADSNKFRLHINSNLIQSDDLTLPDELKSLGVCAYDERAFEKGVLDQMDMQIAEFNGTNDDSDDEDATTLKKVCVKRKLGGIASEGSSKKSKNSDIDGYDENDNEISYSPLMDGESEAVEDAENAEQLIKTGEMTPFGTVVNFKQNSIKNIVNKERDRKKKSHKFDQDNDFDSFLLDFDAKKTTKPVKKPPVVKPAVVKNIDYSSTNNTEFDLFLNGLDTDQRVKVTRKNKSKPESNDVRDAKPCTSSSIEKTPMKKSKTLNFDEQLASLDRVSTASASKKKELVVKSKSASSISVTKIKKTNQSEPDSKSGKETPKKKATDASKAMDSQSFLKIMEDSNNDDTEVSLFDDFEDGNDPDYDTLSNKSNTESDYVTDDDDLDPVEARKRKSRLKRTCMDDGDDKIFSQRMKKLERYEKSLVEPEEQENLELEDLEEVPSEEDSRINLLDKNIIVNNNRHIELDACLKVPENIWNKLYKFQKTCLKWLWELHSQRCGGILGDEMGLGKTVQMAAYLASLKYSRIRSVGFSYIGLGPVLIITPLTLISHWVTELHNWWPYFRVNVLHEIGTSVESPKRKLIDKTFESNGILVTTYASLLIYDSALLAKNWHYVILDEGHKIRNPDAKITIIAKCFRTPHRIILSGSPIQNNLKELWSLFDFVFPGKLGTMVAFMENFSVPINQGGYANASEIQVQTAYKCACILRDTIAPYLLRRVKNDVKLSLQLPNKNEQILFCRLSKEQKDEYLAYLNSRECQYLIKTKTNLLAALVQLRKICNHSDILTEKYYKNPQWVNHSDYDLVQAGEYGYFKRSGKMIVVDTLLKLWKKQEGRVLLFSQSRVMLDILEKYVKEKDYNYLRMDGSTPGSQRAKMVDNFNKNSAIFLFLLTTKVGGLGLNLIGANKIIIFDPDWNPTNDLQARERAWRIGQTRNVTIYRLLTSGTIEEKIYHRQIFKTFLSNKILKDPRQKRFFKANDMHELFSYTCVDDNSVESSALLAGTGSEISSKKLKAKNIVGLTKIRKGKTSNTQGPTDAASFKESDDYVLSKLFKAKKKNGGMSYIHTALQHDKIVDNTTPDFSLVEQEAEKIARDAVRALKESRKFCRTADSGIPNLTGIKFGSKLKVSINSMSNKSADKPVNVSSISLLDRIKMRNQGIHQEKAKTHTDVVEANKTETDDECIAEMSALDLIERSKKMSAMIKEYFTEKTSVMNRATTEQVVEYFKSRTLKEDGPKFKAILKKMCDFDEAKKTWSLKDEYFNL